MEIRLLCTSDVAGSPDPHNPAQVGLAAVAVRAYKLPAGTLPPELADLPLYTCRDVGRYGRQGGWAVADARSGMRATGNYYAVNRQQAVDRLVAIIAAVRPEKLRAAVLAQRPIDQAVAEGPLPDPLVAMAAHNARLYRANEEAFCDLFGVPLMRFWEKPFGFDPCRFSDWCGTPEEVSLADHVESRFGAEARALVAHLCEAPAEEEVQ